MKTSVTFLLPLIIFTALGAVAAPTGGIAICNKTDDTNIQYKVSIQDTIFPCHSSNPINKYQWEGYPFSGCMAASLELAVLNYNNGVTFAIQSNLDPNKLYYFTAYGSKNTDYKLVQMNSMADCVPASKK